MITYNLYDLLLVLCIALLAALAAVSIFFAKYADRQKKFTADIINGNLLEKDGLIKKSIVLEEQVKALAKQFEAADEALKEAGNFEEKLREENKNLFAKISELNSANSILRERTAELTTGYEAKLERQKKDFLELKAELKESFENISATILEEKSKKFLEINKENISGILHPLSEKIIEFQKKVEETYDKESKQRFSLQNEIKKLIDTQDAMKQTTENLTTALKGTGKVQGDWGEMILEQLLEYSGLVSGIQYEIQKTVKTANEMDEKINLRPDVIVHLPQNRDLIIDSKVSLTDYEKYCSIGGVMSAAENAWSGGTAGTAEKDAENYLKLHINSIKRHINELSEKKYSTLLGSKSLDAVIMFIPIEFAYTAAVNYDRELLTYAYGKNVIIATPSIIMLILKIIYNLWVQEKSQEKAAVVMRLAGQLHDKFASFCKSIEEIGSALDKTVAAYDSARKQLSFGKGNLMSRFDKMRLLGAKTSKSLDVLEFDRSDREEVPNLVAGTDADTDANAGEIDEIE